MERVELSNALLRVQKELDVKPVPPERSRDLLRDAAHAIMQMWEDVNQPVIAPA